MAHNVSNEYKQVIYSGDAKNKLKLLFNNVELENADSYCEKLTIKSRIVPNGAKIFSLNNFISKEADLILHDIDTSIIQDQVSISIGTLVGNSYEYVPIGIFNIQDQPTNDKNRTTIKLRDNSVKFDFNYNAQPLIEQNGGVATKLQILQDICSQAGVTCNITSFIGYLDEIGVYDNTITAREYISRIAEQAGRIATISRSGELIFVDLNNLTTWEIPIEIVEKYENGTTYKIGKVVYEDGIVRYETDDSNDDTLFLDGSNNYINGELVKEQASSGDNTYYLEDTSDSELAYFEMEGKTTQASTPTPDSPSELKNVGYQNLLKLGTGTTSRNNTELSVNNNIINFKNTGTTNYVAYGIDNELRNTNYGNYVSWKNMTLKAGTYTLNYEYISGSTTTSTTSSNSLRLIIYGRTVGSTGRLETNLATVYVSHVSSYTKFTIAQDMEINAVAYLYASSATVDLNFKVWIANNPNSCEYILPDEYGVEIKSRGKNICYTDFNKWEGGQYNTSGGKDTNQYRIRLAELIPVLPNTSYYFNTNLNPYNFVIRTYNSDMTFASSVGSISNDSTFTTGVNDYYLGITIWGSTQESSQSYATYQQLFEDGDIKPFICLNSEVDKTYEEYKENKKVYILDEPLRGIGDYKDLLYIKNGYLYVKRKIGNIVLDGTETGWNYQNSCFTINIDGIKETPAYADRDQKLVMSNYFAWQLSAYRGSLQDLHITKAIDSGNPKQIAFKYSTYTSTNDFKTWLSTHNTEVQYVLATPLIEELGEVNMPTAYENITYIDIASKINTNTYLQYRKDKTQLETILDEVDEFDINSLKTGKILGNPAIDSYDLIQITDGNKIFKTLATNDLVYTGVLINTFDTQIGEEAKEQNVFINGEETFKKWARTKIDNVEGSITLQAGQIDEANGRINETNLTIEKDGALLSVLANNSNIDIEYDGDTPISGEVREVTTTTGFKFNAEGMTISDDSSNFYALHRNTGTYYYDGGIDPTKIVGQYTKDGSKQKDLVLFGVYYYGMEEITDTPMFVTELYNDENGEECVGHFYNRGD